MILTYSPNLSVSLAALVVLYADGRGAERQWTIVLETSGEGRGELVRGREEECRQMRAADLAASAASTAFGSGTGRRRTRPAAMVPARRS